MRECKCGKKTAVQYVPGPFHGQGCPMWQENFVKQPVEDQKWRERRERWLKGETK